MSSSHWPYIRFNAITSVYLILVLISPCHVDTHTDFPAPFLRTKCPLASIPQVQWTSQPQNPSQAQHRNQAFDVSRLKRPSDVKNILDRCFTKNEGGHSKSGLETTLAVQQECKTYIAQNDQFFKQNTPGSLDCNWAESPTLISSRMEDSEAQATSPIRTQIFSNENKDRSKFFENLNVVQNKAGQSHFDSSTKTSAYEQDTAFQNKFPSQYEEIPAFRAAIADQPMDLGLSKNKMTPTFDEYKDQSFKLKDNRLPPLYIPQAADLEEEACELLNAARNELQLLTEDWKNSISTAAAKEQEIHSLQEEIERLNIVKGNLQEEKEDIAAEMTNILASKNHLLMELEESERRMHKMQLEIETLSNANMAFQNHIREKDDNDASVYAEELKIQYEAKISVLGQELQNANADRERLWNHIVCLEKSATDAEQLTASQRQQLAALCDALEGAEFERQRLEQSLNATQQSEQTSKNAQRNLEGVIFDYQSQLESMKLAMQQKYKEIESWKTTFACLSENLTETTNCLNEIRQAKVQLERDYQDQIQKLQSKLKLVLEDSEFKSNLNLEKTMKLEAELNATVSKCQELIRRNEMLKTEISTQKVYYEEQLVQSMELARKENEDQIQKAVSQTRENFQVQCESLASKMKQSELMLSQKDKTLRDLEFKNEDFKKQVDLLKQKENQLQAENNHLDSKILTMRSQCEQHTADLNQIQQILQAKDKSLNKTAIDFEMSCDKLREFEVRLKESMIENKLLRSQIQEAEHNFTESRAVKEEEFRKVQIRASEIENLCESLKSDCARLREENLASNQRLQLFEQENGNLKVRIQDLIYQTENSTLEKGSVQSQLLDKCARIEELENMVLRLESREKDLRTENERLIQTSRERDSGMRSFQQNNEMLMSKLSQENEKLRAQLNETALTCEEQRTRLSDLIGRAEASERRCREAEKIAREATRTASKDLNLVQAQASHLRQQVDVLTKEKEDALVSLRRKEQEMEKLRHEWLNRQNEEQKATGHEMMEDDVLAENDLVGNGEMFSKEESQTLGNGELMQSVIAQRTRGKINNVMETGTKAAADPRISAALSAGSAKTRSRTSYAQSQDCQEPSLLQSVIAARTRGRTVEKDSVFVLRHIPVHGGKSPVDIPDAVQLTHTGFVIGRVGADLCLTSGYVSRKHAQFQRTALGWRVLDTSTNGLCVNGIKVRSQQLSDGDILLFEVPQTVGFGQEVPKQWDEKSHFRFRFCIETPSA